MAPERLWRGLAVTALAAAVCSAGASASSRVVGGAGIPVQKAPWAVYVQQDTSSTPVWCSGSILDATHVLTAAHCVYDDNGSLASPSQLSVKAGISNFAAPSATDLEQDRAVSAVRVHPGYAWTGAPAPDDVAVLALANALDLTGPAAQPIELPGGGMAFPAGETLELAGFGLLTNGRSGPLASMTGTIDPQGFCQSTSAPVGVISSNGLLLCTFSAASTVCFGDSGSGLVTTSDPHVLLGVTMAIVGSCRPGSRNLFTYTGAPEILSFIQGNDNPPTAPRVGKATHVHLSWNPPLVAGTTLTCTSKGWPAGVLTTFSFLSADNFAVLQMGPRATFPVPAEDAGKAILCQVAAANAGGTTIVQTPPTPAIRSAPEVTVDQLTPISGVRGGSVTIRVSLHSPRGLWGTFGVCAVPAPPVGSKTCSAEQHDDGASGTFAFDLTLRIRKSAPLATSPVEIDAVAGLAAARVRTMLHVTAG